MSALESSEILRASRPRALALMPDIREPDQIPYADLADRFHDREQRVVPFLGAGVPLSARGGSAGPRAPAPADGANRAAVNKVLDASGVQQPAARALLEWASIVALRLEHEGAARDAVAPNVLKRLVEAETAPSAGELAQLFADRAPYDAFKSLGQSLERRVSKDVLPSEYELAKLMRACFTSVGLDAPIGSLSSIASFYERGDNRETLLGNLNSVLAGKKTPTLSHRLIARVAARQVASAAAGDPNGDYLIITTNYDRLMELALEAEQAPYLVVTARRSDGKVIAVASPHVADEVLKRELDQRKDEFPASFAPQRSRPLVVLYKMHGSIGEGALADDSVVISDNDYVECLSWMTRSERMIPALVGELLRSRAFLFLGYSLNDWNVRSFFRGVIEKRSGKHTYPDYAVLRDFTDFDRVFFHDNGVTILHTDLRQFAQGLLGQLPAEYQVAP